MLRYLMDPLLMVTHGTFLHPLTMCSYKMVIYLMYFKRSYYSECIYLICGSSNGHFLWQELPRCYSLTFSLDQMEKNDRGRITSQY